MAIGKQSTMDNVASMMVSGRPPQRSVCTTDKPPTPPYISAKKAASTATHAAMSHVFQNMRVQLMTSRPTINSVATSGRHCSSNG